jgi:hypothetical protein
MEVKNILKGGCLCGKINYEIKLNKHIDKIKSNYCHCTMCRKASGSGIATFITLPKNDVEINGLNNLIKYKSSENCKRSFCSNCGSQLFWENIDEDTIDIGIGSLNNPEEIDKIKPKYHFWTENKILSIDLDVPKYLQGNNSSLLE